MSIQVISRFVTQKFFKSLPDGRPILSVPGLFRDDYFLIPDATAEQNLRNKVLWINLSLLILGIVGLVVVGYLARGKFIASFILLWWALSDLVCSALIRKGVPLSRLHITRETTYLYDNFTNKVQAGVNDIPEDFEIVQYLDVSGSDDKILLLRYKDRYPLVLRCRLGGSIVWQFECQSEDTDPHTVIEWQQGKLRVASESNYSMLLDRHTGRTVSGT